MFLKKYEEDKLKKILLSKEEFMPFPKACQRSSWEKVSSDVKSNVISNGEKYIDYNWTLLSAASLWMIL